MLDRFIRWAGIVLAGLILFLLAYAAMVNFLMGQAFAHDFYKGVAVKGLPCCGGNGPDADCEPLEQEQIDIKKDQVRIFSKRYGTWITMPEDRIQWMVLPQDPLARPGHYCGVPRTKLKYQSDVSPDEPDPTYRTYCIFLTPGGS